MNKKILLSVSLAAVLVSSSVASAAGTTLQSMAVAIQSSAISIATPIVVIGWVVAGILWLTSAGSPEKTGLAKKAMVACVIGTILVVLAMGSAAIINVIKNAIGIQ